VLITLPSKVRFLVQESHSHLGTRWPAYLDKIRGRTSNIYTRKQWPDDASWSFYKDFKSHLCILSSPQTRFRYLSESLPESLLFSWQDMWRSETLVALGKAKYRFSHINIRGIFWNDVVLLAGTIKHNLLPVGTHSSDYYFRPVPLQPGLAVWRK
jgi:hypothetical protein